MSETVGNINVISCEPMIQAYLFELTHGEGEECDKLLFVLADTYTSNLCQTLQCHIAEHGHVQELKELKHDFVIIIICLDNLLQSIAMYEPYTPVC